MVLILSIIIISHVLPVAVLSGFDILKRYAAKIEFEGNVALRMLNH